MAEERYVNAVIRIKTIGTRYTMNQGELFTAASGYIRISSSLESTARDKILKQFYRLRTDSAFLNNAFKEKLSLLSVHSLPDSGTVVATFDGCQGIQADWEIVEIPVATTEHNESFLNRLLNKLKKVFRYEKV